MISHIYFVFIFIIFTQFSFSQNSNRVITTGVPFLLITSDARAAGMGELGAATSADIYSQQWNPAKYAFSSNSSVFDSDQAQCWALRLAASAPGPELSWHPVTRPRDRAA